VDDPVTPPEAPTRLARTRSGAGILFITTWQRFEGTLAGRFVEALVEMRVVDRSLALASKLFIAILPMSILSTAIISGRAFSDQLVDRFGLTGRGAQAARELFAAPSEVQAGVGFLGILILTSSIVSFARALERVYLDCWQLAPLTRSAVRWRLIWLTGFFAVLAALSLLHDAFDGTPAEPVTWALAAVTGSVFFLWTPYVLLGRRVSHRRLLPTALATGAAMLLLGVGSTLIMPALTSRNTGRYGLIGFTFSLVSWLFTAAVLIISAAILGALLDRRPARPLAAAAIGPIQTDSRSPSS
jgi:membrane protein